MNREALFTNEQILRLRLTETLSWVKAVKTAKQYVSKLVLPAHALLATACDQRLPASLRTALILRLHQMVAEGTHPSLSTEEARVLARAVVDLPTIAVKTIGANINQEGFITPLMDALVQNDLAYHLAAAQLAAENAPLRADSHRLGALYRLLKEEAKKVAALQWPPIEETKTMRETLLKELGGQERAACWARWKDIDDDTVLENLPPFLRAMSILEHFPRDTEKGIQWLTELSDEDLGWLLQHTNARTFTRQGYIHFIEHLIRENRMRAVEDCLLARTAYLDVAKDICARYGLGQLGYAINAVSHLKEGNPYLAIEALSNIEDKRLRQRAINACRRLRNGDALIEYVTNNIATIPAWLVEDILNTERRPPRFFTLYDDLTNPRIQSLGERLKRLWKDIRTNGESYTAAGNRVRDALFAKSLADGDIRFLGKGVFTPQQELRLLEKLHPAHVLWLGLTRNIHSKALGKWLESQRSPWVHFVAATILPPTVHQLKTHIANPVALFGYGVMLQLPIAPFIWGTRFVIAKIRELARTRAAVLEMNRSEQMRRFNRQLHFQETQSAANQYGRAGIAY